MHDLCLDPPNSACDFCGLVVTPIPWLHVRVWCCKRRVSTQLARMLLLFDSVVLCFIIHSIYKKIPGNFWTAKCSYINKLLPPKRYQDAVTEYKQEIALPYLQNKTMNMLFQHGHKRKAGHFFGEDRFSNENWIGSHPSAIPCDVAPVPDMMQYWQQATSTTKKKRNNNKNNNPPPFSMLDFNFSMAPRRDLAYMMEVGFPRIPAYILRKQNLRIRDYHFLGGLISRWTHFYHQIPDKSSWVWSYYPDADIWQDAVATYGGEDAFERVAATVPAIRKKPPPREQQKVEA